MRITTFLINSQRYGHVKDRTHIRGTYIGPLEEGHLNLHTGVREHTWKGHTYYEEIASPTEKEVEPEGMW
jgi:hypothetical protein